MTEKEKLLQPAEKVSEASTKSPKTKLLTALTAWALMLAAADAEAQEAKVQEEQTDQKEILYQAPADMPDSTIIWPDTVKASDFETDDKWWDVLEWWDDPDEDDEPIDTTDTEKDSGSKFSIWWMIQVWSGVAWYSAEVCSPRPELLTALDFSHKKTWLWLSIVRLDDFSKDPSAICSQATIVSPYWTKTFWPDWKIRVTAEWPYTIIDKAPELSEFQPDVKVSYTDKWWTVEWLYIHKFKKGKDSDAFRLSVSKKFDEAFQLTLQWWYETWYDKHFYGRIITSIDLWKWFTLEMSCIAKHGKLTPTAWIIYRFQK